MRFNAKVKVLAYIACQHICVYRLWSSVDTCAHESRTLSTFTSHTHIHTRNERCGVVGHFSVGI